MASGSNSHPLLKKCVIAVGGGKGGTGKSLLAANLGIALTEFRQQVILVDLDLGGANLHTCLGLRSPEATLGDFLQNKTHQIQDVLIPTRIENLHLLNGSNDPLEIANLPHSQKTKLIRRLKSLHADYIILDLGGGTSLNVLDFFLSADYGIVVATPEPTSMENVSLFVKCFMMRHLKGLLKKFPTQFIKNRIKDPRNRDTVRTFKDLLRLIQSFDEDAAGQIEKDFLGFRFGLVLNKLREHSETQLSGSFQSMIRRCLGVRVDNLGHISYDDKIRLAVKKFQPFLVEHPHSKASHAIRLVAKRILGMDHLSYPLEQGGVLFPHPEKKEPKSHPTKRSPKPQTPKTNSGAERPARLRFYL